jgi:hypothetical protein
LGILNNYKTTFLKLELLLSLGEESKTPTLFYSGAPWKKLTSIPGPDTYFWSPQKELTSVTGPMDHRLALSKGSNRISVSLSSSEGRNRYSFWSVMLSS